VGGSIGDPTEDPERRSEEERAQSLIDLIESQCEPDIWLDSDTASIRYYQGVLIIRAPDFVHRQIDGYPFAPRRPRVSNATGVVERRYVTFTPNLSLVETIGFTGTTVQGAAGSTQGGGGGTGGNSGGARGGSGAGSPPAR
jgi:uncharacterized membrane protein YgcG